MMMMKTRLMLIVAVLPFWTNVPSLAAEIPATAEATVLHAVEALKDQEPGKLWELMPESYQRDVNDVVHGFADKMPKEAWNRSFSLLGKSFDMLKSQKKLVLSHPLVAFSGVNVREIDKPYDGAMSALSTLAKSDLGDLEKVRTTDAGELFGSVADELSKEMAKIAPTLPGAGNAMVDLQKSLDSIKVKTIESSDDKAELEITSLNKEVEFDNGAIKESWVERTERVSFTKVEGKWIPTDMASEFKTGIEQAKKQIDALPKEQVDLMAQMALAQVSAIEPMIDELSRARNQQQFNIGIQKLMQHFQQMQGGPGGRPGRPQ